MARVDTPNILVFWGDDFGWWNISYNNRGQMGYRTPNIDRIGSGGVVCTDFSVQHSCTAGIAGGTIVMYSTGNGTHDDSWPDTGVAPFRSEPTERHLLERWLADARRMLGPPAYLRACEDGHTSVVDQAVSLAEAVIAELHTRASPTDTTLTPREREVTILLARGLTNKQIAAELVITPATARSHVEHILAKLDLRSRAQIAVWASQRGLLDPEVTSMHQSSASFRRDGADSSRVSARDDARAPLTRARAASLLNR